MQDGVCVVLEQLEETAGRAKAALTAKKLLGGALAGLRRREQVASAA